MFTKMATGGSELTSDEILHIKCCLCVKDNRRREAEKYCVQCCDYYCLTCAGLHDKFPFTEGHKFLDKTDFRTLEKDANLPSIPTSRCIRHPTKVVDMFCQDHDAVACASCIALDHRACRTVLSVQDEVDQLHQTAALNDAKLKIKELKKEIEQICKVREAKLEGQKDVLTNAIETVKRFREELQAILNEIETETIHVLRQRSGEIEASLVEEVATMQNILGSLDERALQFSQADGNRAQEFVTVKISEKQIAENEKVLRAMRTKTDPALHFIPDESIKQHIQGVKLFGRVFVKDETNERQKEEMMPKDSLYRVKNKREIDVRLQKDSSKCNIRGSSITDDGYLLLADNNNYNLKRLDLTTEKVKDFVNLQAKPRAVCTITISKTSAAVALTKNSIQLLSLGNTMTMTHTLSMSHPCWGLAYHDGKLFITDGSKTLYIYDITGNQLQSISTDVSGKNLFQSNNNVSITGDRVFVTDRQLGLLVLDIQGNYLSTVGNINITHPRVNCTDGRNVFVSYWNSGNIIQIGHELKLLGTISTFQNLRSLCFDHRRNAMIATGYQDKILILELE